MKPCYIILLALFIYSSATFVYRNDIIHEGAELGKVCHLKDGQNVVISKKTDSEKILISKLDERGNYIYHNTELNLGYTGNAQIMESAIKDGQTQAVGYTLYHKNLGKEYLTQINDEGQKIASQAYTTFQEQVSAFTLANGNIFFVGISNPPANYAQTTINLRVYDPRANTNLSGKTLVAYSKYISCYEQTDNEVYCAYVYHENPLRSLLGIQNFKIGNTGIINESPVFLIKAFYTQFNFIKAIKYNNNEVAIIFQTGTGNKNIENVPLGDSGKDLHYYHLKVSSNSMEVIRYDYMSSNCRFTSEAEDYTNDIIVLENSVMVICEVENEGKNYAKMFRAYNITDGIKKIDPIDFNNFNGIGVKNPSFVKFKNLVAILYTHLITETEKNVNLLMMNYPDCNEIEGNVKYYAFCPNGNQTRELNKFFDVFMVNPYPSFMQNVNINFRFTNLHNMVIFNGDTKLEADKDYNLENYKDLYISEFTDPHNTYIEYTSSREDSAFGVVLGKTCKIQVVYPTCREECLGCDIEGTPDDHHCFDCQPGFYGKVMGKDTTGCGTNSSYYNCYPCDIACEQCHGPIDYGVPTTNCKENYCNYEDNYFPYEEDFRTCFNESDKERWEDLLGIEEVLFLDKSAGNNKRDWVWRKCHNNCGACEARGDDNDNKCTVCKNNLFFFCNQTKDNGGIPGSCHESCEGDGCYKSNPKDTENMEKMCPCFENCKTCQGPDLCDVCRNTWLLPPERTSCDKSCAFCLTPYWEREDIQENGRCINCKTEFEEEQYTFNGKCYTKANMPKFTYTEYGQNNLTYSVVKPYHVINSTCNLLTGCKRGCHKCSVLETDKCTECEDNYYKEDPFNIERKTFRCFNKTTCIGVDQYPHDPEFHAGGVAIEEDGEKICLNCKQRNNTFRLPEDKFYCSDEKINRTYIDIVDYNKLSYCYVRCKECDRHGISCEQNCIKCRDSKYYDLIKYSHDYGNCYRKQHKCGIYPYYHNYELADNEDECGEDCDVCLYNFQCPKEFPYFKFETHECVEFCPVTDVFSGMCNVNYSAAAIILMRNPFGLRNPYDFLNSTISLQQLFSSSLFQYLCASYNCDVNALSKDINNYIGNGKVYNLPESKIIVGNNITLELSSVKLELEKIAKYLRGELSEDDKPNTSAMNISTCANILKKKYGLPEEEDLIIIKADISKELNLSALLPELPDIEYQMFSTSLGAFLPLSVCQQENAEVTVTNPIDSNPFGSFNLLELFQSKTSTALANGYDVFDAYSPFYNDICTPFTNENGNDVLLDDRRKYYYDDNIQLCGKDCTFIGYNTASKTYTCRCNIKGTAGVIEDYKGEIQERKMPDDFLDLISKRSNIEVFKCSSQVFSAEGQKKNYGSYILLACLAALIGVGVFHFVKEKEQMEATFDKLRHKNVIKSENEVMNSNNNNVANPPKNEKEKKENNKKEEKKKHDKVKEPKKNLPPTTERKLKSKKVVAKKDSLMEDDAINFASYNDFINRDKRTFGQMYWSFLKFKQSIIFTFFTNSKGILRSTKITLFILFFAFYMAFTALFFNDSIMRKIYIYKGSTDAAVHVPNVILSSLCSFIASLIVRYICLGERDIFKAIHEKNSEKKRALLDNALVKAKIKIYILYGLSAMLICLCWYYASAFCAVFKNSQGHYLTNTIVAFIVCNLWPILTSLIPTFMRIKAKEKKSSKLYIASKIVSVF